MANIVGTHPAGIKPLGYEQITVGDTAEQLTVPPKAIRAILGVEAQPLRWRDDGVDPDSSTGFLVESGVAFELIGTSSLKAFRAIRSGGTNATLNVIYYGE